MPRGIGSGVITELNKTTIEGLIYLVKLTLRSGTYFYGERVVTYDGNPYLPKLESIGGLSQEFGESGEVQFTFCNLDGTFTTLDRNESFLGAKVEIIEYLSGLGSGYVKWVGWSDELREITPTTASLIAYTGSPSTRVEAPKRSISLQCPWEFGNTSSWIDGTEFEGSECPYQRVTTVGFRTTLTDNINDSDDPVTFGVDPLSFVALDEIKIDSEIMLIINVVGYTLTCARAKRGTTKAAHSIGAYVYFSNCHNSKEACVRRGMYGNNSNDTYVSDSVTKERNYFGGFPLLTGQVSGRFRDRSGKRWLTITFSGNESAYGKPLPLIYGRVRFVNPTLIIARPEGDFLLTLFAVSEGLLGTNANNAAQDNTLAAYVVGGDGLENIYVNGSKRHDPRPGYGIQVFNGQQDQPEPAYFTGLPDFVTNHLGLWGTAWVLCRISRQNNPSVDPSQSDVTGDFEIRYGRCVRVYTTPSAYTFKPSGGSPVWALLDYATSKRAGGGIDYTRVDIQSFLDAQTYCIAYVKNIVDGSDVPRWTFNGSIDNARPYSEHERQLCLGMYCVPPFIDISGKIKIKMLKSESTSGVPLFSSKDPTTRNILADSEGVSTLRKARKLVTELPNQIRVDFAGFDSDTNEWIKTRLVLDDKYLQRQVGTLLGDKSLRIVPKSVDLLGTTTVDEAARIGTLILRAGEFALGGTMNNLTVTFDTLYRTSANLELGDVIQIEDDLLSATTEVYFRVVKLEDIEQTVEDGGFLFTRHITATIHNNDIYDDTAYTITENIRLEGFTPHDTSAPAVTNFAVAEEGVFDVDGVPHSKLTFTYDEPSPIANFKDVVIMRSTESGGVPVGDWRVVAQIQKSGASIYYDISNAQETFTALSRNIWDVVPDPDTVLANSSYKYPRVQVTVDGVQDVLPTVSNVAAIPKGDRILITWDSYAAQYINLLKYYEVWRADSTIDPSTDFTVNADKTKISNVYTTQFIDDSSVVKTNTTRLYIYWIRGVSIVGVASAAHVGVSCRASEDSDVPNAPVIAVVAGLQSDGSVRFTFGAERATSNYHSIDYTQFQITRDSDPSFVASIFDQKEPGAPAVVFFMTSENDALLFRARQHNDFGDGAWSSVVTKGTFDALDTADIDVPGIVQDITISVKDVDPDVPGNELVVGFSRPLTNFNTLFCYAVQVYTDPVFPTDTIDDSSSSGVVVKGQYTLTDTTKNWAAGVHAGKTLYLYRSGHRFFNTIIVSNTATVLTCQDAFRESISSLSYAIISEPSWEKVTRSIDVPTSILDPTINSNTWFRVVISGLSPSTYWIRIMAANVFGSGDWSASLPVGGANLSGVAYEDLSVSLQNQITAGADIPIFQIVAGTFLNYTPFVGYVSWVNVKVKYKSTTYDITNGYTNLPWVTWSLLNPTIFSAHGSPPALGENDFFVLLNDGGVYVAQWKPGQRIYAERVITAYLSALSAYLGEVISGTITGCVIRTAESGARLELNSANGLRGYDAAGNVLTQITTGGLVTLKSAASGARIELDSTSGLRGIDAGGVVRSQVKTDGQMCAYSIRSLSAGSPSTLVLGFGDGIFGFYKGADAVQGGIIIASAYSKVQMVASGSILADAHLELLSYKVANEVRIGSQLGGIWVTFSSSAIALASGVSIDCKTNSAKIQHRYSADAVPTMLDGEGLFHYDGANFWWLISEGANKFRVQMQLWTP